LDNNKYAIKILDKNRIIEMDLIDSIKTEVQLLKTVHHPYIVKLVEVMTTKQKILLIMEYVEGGDLFDLISNII
jgi:5'-AMP-activated protein kinase catalytic alpha subunit